MLLPWNSRRRSTMTVRIILRVLITLFVVYPACEGLRGDSAAICRRTISRKESRYVPYLETYKQKVFGVSFRIKTRFNYKTENHVVWTTEAVCCDGYRNSGGTCLPLCSQQCTNGRCVKPNICECDRGYALDFFGQKCDPLCAIPCVFGRCSAPQTCTCDDGYEIRGNKYTCEPICPSGCNHGHCSEPNVCVCEPGYQLNDANQCNPVCDRPCVNGKCVAPDTCTCNDGYQRSPDDDFDCVPRCSEPCLFGSCTAPESCTCNIGYRMSAGSNNTCTPVCNETCVFGSCVSPDTCSCDDGYALTTESKYTCKPLCEDDCVNGNCVGPNVCECLDGYVKLVEGTRCEPHCDDPCTNGVCTAPNICTCNMGYRQNVTTKNCEPVCTEPCINGVCESPETCACLEGYTKPTNDSSTCEIVCENCANGFCETPNECICKDGFIKDEMDNKTCVVSCKPECLYGACSAMGCVCDFGWGGNSCGEPLFCVVSKPFKDVFLEAESHTISKAGESNGTGGKIGNRKKLDKPSCDVRCLSEVNSSTIHINKTSTEEVRYFIPIDSPCNIAAARTMISRTYFSVIGIVIGTILCAMVIYSLYLIRISKNHKTEINSGSRECVFREEVEDTGVVNPCYENI